MCSQISKCRAETDLGLYMTLILAKRMRLCRANFRFKNVFGRGVTCDNCYELDK